MTLTNEQIQALKDKYGVPDVLRCDMCGHDAWRDEEHLSYSCDYGHSFSTRRSGDPDVIALLAEREADKALIAEQAKSNTFLKEQLAQLANFNPDWDKLEAATDSLREHMTELTAANKRIAELQSENEYIRKRFKESDLMFGKNILVMQAAIIEWQGTGDAKNGLAWIYNTLFGPGELPDEAEKDAQAYFDRKHAPLDEELMALHQWFWAHSEAERAAAGITLVVGGEDATNSR